MNNNLLKFFNDGGVFLFDENDSASERVYYQVEDLMGEEIGQNITEVYLEDETTCLLYDCSVLEEEDVFRKYSQGQYVKSF